MYLGPIPQDQELPVAWEHLAEEYENHLCKEFGRYHTVKGVFKV
jgi:hypothetical protein